MRRARTARVAVLACTAAALLALGLKAEFITETTPVPPVGAPGGPSRPLSPADLARWKRGRALFDRDWHLADGVGRPDMNGDSCRACHQDPAIGGAGGLDLNVSRFGLDNGGQGPFMNLPGGQIASRLRRPDMPGREEFDPTTADVFEQRQTPTLFGSGLIDGIPESEILANADPMDLNGDGIAGVARMIDASDGRRASPPWPTSSRTPRARRSGSRSRTSARGSGSRATTTACPTPSSPDGTSTTSCSSCRTSRRRSARAPRTPS